MPKGARFLPRKRAAEMAKSPRVIIVSDMLEGILKDELVFPKDVVYSGVRVARERVISSRLLCLVQQVVIAGIDTREDLRVRFAENGVNAAPGRRSTSVPRDVGCAIQWAVHGCSAARSPVKQMI